MVTSSVIAVLATVVALAFALGAHFIQRKSPGMKRATGSRETDAGFGYAFFGDSGSDCSSSDGGGGGGGD